jgi:hypothetical protein
VVGAAMVESLLLPPLSGDSTAEATRKGRLLALPRSSRLALTLSRAETNGNVHGARPSLVRQCGSSATGRVARPTRVVRSDGECSLTIGYNSAHNA